MGQSFLVKPRIFYGRQTMIVEIILYQLAIAVTFNLMKTSYAKTNSYQLTTFWGAFLGFVLSTSNRIYIGWFGILMFPLVGISTIAYIAGFLSAPPVDIDGIREPVSGSLLYGNNLISGSVIPSSNAIGVHFYPVWESVTFDEWLYNGGTYQFIVLHFITGVSCWMGREWEFSFRWINIYKLDK